MDTRKIIAETLSSTVIDNMVLSIDSGQLDRFACLRMIDKLYNDVDPTEKELEGTTAKTSKLELRELLVSIKEAETSDVARGIQIEALLLLEKILKKLEAKDRKETEV